MVTKHAFEIENNDDVFNAVAEYLIANKKTKVKKGTILKVKGQDFTLKHSFIGIMEPGLNKEGQQIEILVPYALANRRIKNEAKIVDLGEGAYGRVKMAQGKDGTNYAMKIEGEGGAANHQAEKDITMAIGFLKGEKVRDLAEPKDYKGKQTSTKKYALLELKQGKELFQHLYANALRPDDLMYVPGERKRISGKRALDPLQINILAMQCAKALADLHHRNVIHGDIKPANFMADIKGNHIVVGAIDFGFSFQLEEGQNIIEHSGYPEGTPKVYMPSEVLRPHQGGKAHFSKASDIYSLGIMFRDDLGLPEEVYGPMLAENPSDRANLNDVMRGLALRTRSLGGGKDTPKEATAVADEILQGVKRIAPDAGPKSKKSYVAQLMSGFRDPADNQRSSVSTTYSSEDYDLISRTIYGYYLNEDRSINPLLFFEELIEALIDQNLTDNETKLFLNNAEIFIAKLIQNNTEQSELNYQQVTEVGFMGFIEAAREHLKGKPELEAKLTTMEETFKREVTKVTRANQSISSSKGSSAPGRPISLIKRDKKDRKQLQKDIALDLKQKQLALLRNLNMSDFQRTRWTKQDRIGHELSISQIIKMANNLGYMVAKEILDQKNVEDQKFVYNHYLNVAKQCIEINDFASANAIFSGLNLTSIDRLKHLGTSAGEKRKFAELKRQLDPASGYKNLRPLQDKAEQEGEPFVPYIGMYLTDLNGFGEQPETKKYNESGDTFKKFNESKIRGEGLAVKTIMEARNRAIAASRQAYLTDIIPAHAEEVGKLDVAKLEDDLFAESCKFFAPRGPISLSSEMTLERFTQIFADKGIQGIPHFLIIKLDNTELEGKKAFQALVELAMPLFEQAKLVDMYDNSLANTILNSIEAWAKENRMGNKRFQESVEKARRSITPSQSQRAAIVKLEGFKDHAFERYLDAEQEGKETLRQELNAFQAQNDASVKKIISDILKEMDDLDKIQKLGQTVDTLPAAVDANADIHQLCHLFVELQDLQKEINQLFSKNQAVNDLKDALKDRINQDNSGYNVLKNAVTQAIIAKMDTIKAIAKDLSVDSLENKENKAANDAKLNDLKKVLDALKAHADEAVKQEAQELRDALEEPEIPLRERVASSPASNLGKSIDDLSRSKSVPQSEMVRPRRQKPPVPPPKPAHLLQPIFEVSSTAHKASNVADESLEQDLVLPMVQIDADELSANNTLVGVQDTLRDNLNALRMTLASRGVDLNDVSELEDIEDLIAEVDNYTAAIEQAMDTNEHQPDLVLSVEILTRLKEVASAEAQKYKVEPPKETAWQVLAPKAPRDKTGFSIGQRRDVHHEDEDSMASASMESTESVTAPLPKSKVTIGRGREARTSRPKPSSLPPMAPIPSLDDAQSLEDIATRMTSALNSMAFSLRLRGVNVADIESGKTWELLKVDCLTYRNAINEAIKSSEHKADLTKILRDINELEASATENTTRINLARVYSSEMEQSSDSLRTVTETDSILDSAEFIPGSASSDSQLQREPKLALGKHRKASKEAKKVERTKINTPADQEALTMPLDMEQSSSSSSLSADQEEHARALAGLIARQVGQREAHKATKSPAQSETTSSRKQPLVQARVRMNIEPKTVAGQAENISLNEIYHAAVKEQQKANGTVQDVKRIKTTEDVDAVVVRFKTEKQDKTLDAYAEDTGHDSVRFSISKNMKEEEAKLTIYRMCKIAVDAANEDTVFHIPKHLDETKKQWVKEGFNRALVQAIQVENRFKADKAPSVEGMAIGTLLTVEDPKHKL